MLSIAVYSKSEETIKELNELIKTYYADNGIFGRYQIFSDMKDLLTAPNRFEIYVMDLEDNKEEALILGLEMKQKDAFGYFIYLDIKDNFYDAILADADYFLTKPIWSASFFSLLNKIRKIIKADTIVISTPIGDRKIRTSNLNYIDIQSRCLCYHLNNGVLYDGKSLRGSFEKSITPLQEQPSLLFLPPSLLINIENVDVLNADHLYFENGDKLYFPKKHHDFIETRWHGFNNFVNSKLLKK